MIGKGKPTAPRKKKGVRPELAAAMIDHARTKSIKLYLEKHGPVYVRAVVPKYAQRDFELRAYSAWYIGHVDPMYLGDEQFDSYVNEFDGGGWEDGLEGFMSFLETKGYIVFNSAHEDGVIIVDTDCS